MNPNSFEMLFSLSNRPAFRLSQVIVWLLLNSLFIAIELSVVYRNFKIFVTDCERPRTRVLPLYLEQKTVSNLLQDIFRESTCLQKINSLRIFYTMHNAIQNHFNRSIYKIPRIYHAHVFIARRLFKNISEIVHLLSIKLI